MGILNQIWWLMGIMMAGPLVVPGIGAIVAGSYPKGVLFLVLGFFVLLLPEYIRWQLLGGSSPFERVPLMASRANQRER